MGLKQDVVIKSKFGTKSAGNYILRYTSRDDATESLEIYDYITKYTPRYNATEELKQKGSLEDEVWEKDEALTRKEGVMFGNRGISYSDKTLKEAARSTQKATDDGHVAIIPILSFSHEYLVEKGIVDKDMPEPENEGDYKGKIDQLKMRQAITDMMNKMHQDMGFNKPEWTATIQLDTKHVHAHITTVETEKSKDKRMIWVNKEQPTVVPRMKWLVDDKSSEYSISKNKDGFITYKRNNEIVATQEETKKGKPKWTTNNVNTGEKELVERGKIHESTKTKMRNRLDRSLSQTKDIKPFVKDIGDKRRLTKSLTINTIDYNDVTAKKLQALQIALPDNKKMWRANSNAKKMERAHELANEIIDDIWTRHRNGVDLEEYENAINSYIDTRQFDEKFDDDYREVLYSTEFDRLRKESINALYKHIKANVQESDKTQEIPIQSIKAASTDTLQNEIAKDLNGDSENEPYFNQMVQFEYRSRDYKTRFKHARYQAHNYKSEIDRYDQLEDIKETSEDSKVVREHYQKEYEYYAGVRDKYDYLTNRDETRVSKERFDNVKGTDLVNMLYDYGKNSNRSVPREVASRYELQTNARKQALDNTLNYLIDTGQFEQYEIMKNHRESIRKEADISKQINEELNIPIPKYNGGQTIEKRKTIDTIQGRRLLKEEISELQSLNREFIDEYEAKGKNKKQDIPKTEYHQDTLIKEDNYAKYHMKQEQNWSKSRLEFDMYINQAEKRRKEEEILKSFYDVNSQEFTNYNDIKDVKFKESSKEEIQK